MNLMGLDILVESILAYIFQPDAGFKGTIKLQQTFMPAILLELLVDPSLNFNSGLFFYLVRIFNNSVRGGVQVYYAYKSRAKVVCYVKPGQKSNSGYLLVTW